MSATTLQSIREKRGSIDTLRHQPVELVEKWRVEVGSIRLWIIGPGPAAMFMGSTEYYTGRIGTDEERARANRAVEILNLYHRNNDAGAMEIIAALKEAEHQLANNLPVPLPPGMEPLPPITKRKLILADEEDARRICAAVEFVTGISAKEFSDKTGRSNQRGDVSRARVMCIAACKTLFQDMTGKKMDGIFSLGDGTCTHLLQRHHTYQGETKYAANLAAVLSKLS
jgi:hypothetical protein